MQDRVIEHLKIAKRLHFQGLNDDAIKEYQLVLELDPENEDGINGLRALGVEPPDPAFRLKGAEHAGGLKTSFFVNQAKEGHVPAWKSGPVKLVMLLLMGLFGFAVYQFAMLLVNFDNIKAMENVDAHIEKLKQMEDGATTCNVKIANFNPAPIKNIVLNYTIKDAAGNSLKESKINIKAAVPAGDSRVFSDVDLGILKGKGEKLEQKLESVVYGPKPKLKQSQIDKFIEAAAKLDKDAFSDYDELTQDADTFAPALIGMGRSYAARSDWKRAIEQYKKAQECDPDNANAHYYMGIALFYNKDLPGARKEMEAAIALAPDDPAVNWNLEYVLNTRDPKKSDKDKGKGGDKGGDKGAGK